MASEFAAVNSHQDTVDVVVLAEGKYTQNNPPSHHLLPVNIIQKVVAELVGTYFVVFAGCAAVMVNQGGQRVITHPGVAVVWGLAVTVMVYSLSHISGAHFNPSVTIALATSKRFPCKQVPVYVAVQILGSTLASGTLRLIFNGDDDKFAGTLPAGSEVQSLVIEFVITFFLMFVISGVATDNRAIRELGGVAVGATVLVNVMFSGPVSGASMNPARSLGPAIVWMEYRGVWIYVVAPTCGAVCGAWVYNLLRITSESSLAMGTSSSSFKI